MKNGLLVPSVLLLLAAIAYAHSGEYRVPLPPPRIDEEPTPGTPERPSTAERSGPVTPVPGSAAPVRPVPRPTGIPAPPRPGIRRDDDRLTVKIWWELNRHRFLPAHPELPRSEELTRILMDAEAAGDNDTREQALVALGRIRAGAAFDRMRRACADRSVYVRISGMLGLGLLGDDSASPILKTIVASAEASVDDRTFAALSLGLIGSADNAPYLREVLNEEWQPHVRSAAALALGLLRDPEAVEPLGEILLDTHSLVSPEISPPDRPPVRTGLRCAAAQALGEILTPRAYDYLVAALESGEPAVRATAAIALASAPGTIGLPALGRMLCESCPLQVKQFSLLGLAERGEPRSIEMAREILASPAKRTGRMAPFAALALGLARDAAHTETLVELLGDKTVSRETRAAAALALGLSGDRGALKPLEAAMAKETVPAIVSAAVIADALLGGGRATPLAVKILVDSDLPEAKRDAATALRIAADPEATKALDEALEHSYYVNREAALALARTAPDRVVAELAERLGSESAEARRFAAFTTGVLLDRRSPAPLARIIARLNVLCGAPVLKGLIYKENEYLYRLVGGF